MHISFMRHRVELNLWESKEKMIDFLHNCEEGSFLFESQNQEKEFYSASVLLNGDRHLKIGIGICSEGHGLVPLMFPLPKTSTLLFGFNSNVVGISVANKNLAFSLTLDALFYSFLPILNQEILLIQHEIGVVALKSNGRILWHFSKDIVTDLSLIGENLRLDFMDESFAYLNLLDGTPIKTKQI